MRIGDLRRGGADDNRVSPAGHGLRSVVLSAALEFNYLQAAIGFLALILGPALVVGLAPSVVVTYGRLKWQAATSAGDSLLVALVLLVVLGGVALWLGRPLVAMGGGPVLPRPGSPVFSRFLGVRGTRRG